MTTAPHCRRLGSRLSSEPSLRSAAAHGSGSVDAAPSVLSGGPSLHHGSVRDLIVANVEFPGAPVGVSLTSPSARHRHAVASSRRHPALQLGATVVASPVAVGGIAARRHAKASPQQAQSLSPSQSTSPAAVTRAVGRHAGDRSRRGASKTRRRRSRPKSAHPTSSGGAGRRGAGSQGQSPGRTRPASARPVPATALQRYAHLLGSSRAETSPLAAPGRRREARAAAQAQHPYHIAAKTARAVRVSTTGTGQRVVLGGGGDVTNSLAVHVLRGMPATLDGVAPRASQAAAYERAPRRRPSTAGTKRGVQAVCSPVGAADRRATAASTLAQSRLFPQAQWAHRLADPAMLRPQSAPMRRVDPNAADTPTHQRRAWESAGQTEHARTAASSTPSSSVSPFRSSAPARGHVAGGDGTHRSPPARRPPVDSTTSDVQFAEWERTAEAGADGGVIHFRTPKPDPPAHAEAPSLSPAAVAGDNAQRAARRSATLAKFDPVGKLQSPQVFTASSNVPQDMMTAMLTAPRMVEALENAKHPERVVVVPSDVLTRAPVPQTNMPPASLRELARLNYWRFRNPLKSGLLYGKGGRAMPLPPGHTPPPKYARCRVWLVNCALISPACCVRH